ncbi:hypothetical protein EJD97_007005 [Solanum chilense]|uniref:Uncharacterized protein n=1 Tax=Solanum chilense TaxID=4083 RepID=A0A6N2BNL3_SOLCI|nr:hypothetical protein EJD97_007005 [Solanum chilense]
MARKCIVLAYLIFLSFSAMASIPNSTKKYDQEDHLHSPSVICYQFQRIRHCPPFPPQLSSPLSSSSLDEIDPRFGAEKRSIPSGPNPLHN